MRIRVPRDLVPPEQRRRKLMFSIAVLGCFVLAGTIVVGGIIAYQAHKTDARDPPPTAFSPVPPPTTGQSNQK